MAGGLEASVEESLFLGGQLRLACRRLLREWRLLLGLLSIRILPVAKDRFLVFVEFSAGIELVPAVDPLGLPAFID